MAVNLEAISGRGLASAAELAKGVYERYEKNYPGLVTRREVVQVVLPYITRPPAASFFRTALIDNDLAPLVITRRGQRRAAEAEIQSVNLEEGTISPIKPRRRFLFFRK